MASVEQFSDDVELIISGSEQVVGFDPSILVPLVLQILIDVLGNCSDPDTVEKRMQNPKNFWTRWATRKAIRQAEKESETDLSSKDRNVLKDAIESRCEQCDAAEIKALISDIDDNTEYTLF
ncbi:MAG: hypothetical protein ACPHF4_08770 [Rubripirellula sp.]